MYRHEGSHFFYVTLHNLVINLIRRYRKKANLKILDAGCGTGMLALQMQKLGKVDAFDASSKARFLSRKRGIDAKRGNLLKIPYASNKFDIATCIDVLISVDDDMRALSQLNRVLVPGGILIVRVSADKKLILSHDKYIHGVRRYEKGELGDKLRQAGFSIERLTYMNFSLYPLAWLKHIEEVVFPPKFESVIGETNFLINKLLTWEIDLENRWLENHDLPIGLGVLAVARKRVNGK